MLTMGQWVIAEKSSKVDFVDIQREFQGVFFFFFHPAHDSKLLECNVSIFWEVFFFFFQDYKDAGRDFSKVHLKGFSEDKKLFYKKSC